MFATSHWSIANFHLTTPSQHCRFNHSMDFDGKLVQGITMDHGLKSSQCVVASYIWSCEKAQSWVRDASRQRYWDTSSPQYKFEKGLRWLMTRSESIRSTSAQTLANQHPLAWVHCNPGPWVTENPRLKHWVLVWEHLRAKTSKPQTSESGAVPHIPLWCKERKHSRNQSKTKIV